MLRWDLKIIVCKLRYPNATRQVSIKSRVEFLNCRFNCPAGANNKAVEFVFQNTSWTGR